MSATHSLKRWSRILTLSPSFSNDNFGSPMQGDKICLFVDKYARESNTLSKVYIHMHQF